MRCEMRGLSCLVLRAIPRASSVDKKYRAFLDPEMPIGEVETHRNAKNGISSFIRQERDVSARAQRSGQSERAKQIAYTTEAQNDLREYASYGRSYFHKQSSLSTDGTLLRTNGFQLCVLC